MSTKVHIESVNSCIFNVTPVILIQMLLCIVVPKYHDLNGRTCHINNCEIPKYNTR